MSIEEDFVCLHEFPEAARKGLKQDLWQYLLGATETETTARRNRLALDQLGFRKKVLRDVGKVDTSATLFGANLRMPVMLAPIGGLDDMHPEGGKAVAVGAAAGGAMYMHSYVGRSPIPDVRAAAPDAELGFALYVRGGDDWIDEYVKLATDHGFRFFGITVDSAVYSRRERDIAARFAKPWRIGADDTRHYQASFNWDAVRRFRDRHPDVPLVLKGIEDPDDAEMAVELGSAAVYVSNHGGRQLDHGIGSVAALPEILERVAGRVPVIVDGSICRGSDVVKALCLGASAVAIGRLYGYALSAAGAPGVARMLDLLHEEIVEVMALLGATSIADLKPDFLRPAPSVTEPHQLSAFPLIPRE
jgi:isopentenyl diphosphate isomerase/L-lactate dehydrogenase-like FMN-dependent dehydrogenase